MQRDAMHVEVARSRIKMIACLLGCAMLIAASLAIIAYGSALTLIVGTVGLLTFAAFGIGWILLLVRPGPGLVVDSSGFQDTSSLTAVGRVLWADVTGTSELRISGTSFVIVAVRAPEIYVGRLRGASRIAAIANHRLFGSPITIAAVGLKTDFTGLSELLRESLRRSREPWLGIPQ